MGIESSSIPQEPAPSAFDELGDLMVDWGDDQWEIDRLEELLETAADRLEEALTCRAVWCMCDGHQFLRELGR